MTKILVLAAGLALAQGSAGACEFMRSADTGVDQTVVASVAVEEEAAQSKAIVLPDTATAREEAAE